MGYTLQEINSRRNMLVEKQERAIALLNTLTFEENALQHHLREKIHEFYGPAIDTLDQQMYVAEWFMSDDGPYNKQINATNTARDDL